MVDSNTPCLGPCHGSRAELEEMLPGERLMPRASPSEARALGITQEAESRGRPLAPIIRCSTTTPVSRAGALPETSASLSIQGVATIRVAVACTR